MRSDRRQGLSVEVTLLVALLLVVQAFFSGLSLGSRAEASDLSAGILCSTIGTAGTASDQPLDRSHLVDCCTLGCPMLGGQPLPETASIPLPTERPAVASISAAVQGIEVARAELAPRNSRAPPRLG